MSDEAELQWLVEMLKSLHEIKRWADNEGCDTTLVQILGPPIGHVRNLIAEAVIGDELAALRNRKVKP
jgi:hypothetical protein